MCNKSRNNADEYIYSSLFKNIPNKFPHSYTYVMMQYNNALSKKTIVLNVVGCLNQLITHVGVVHQHQKLMKMWKTKQRITKLIKRLEICS